VADVLVEAVTEVLVVEGDTQTDLIETAAAELLLETETINEVVEVAETEVLVEQVSTSEVLLETAEAVELLEVGIQGPPGPPGQAGVTYLTFIADGPVGGHRVVVTTSAGKVGYADNTNLSHVSAVVGITLGAAVDGAPVNVQTAGEITEPSWNWTLQQPVFLAANGLLTQTAPASGFHLVVGVPTAPTTLIVSIKQPFVLGA
jgi:hypothetical protein